MFTQPIILLYGAINICALHLKDLHKAQSYSSNIVHKDNSIETMKQVYLHPMHIHVVAAYLMKGSGSFSELKQHEQEKDFLWWVENPEKQSLNYYCASLDARLSLQ